MLSAWEGTTEVELLTCVLTNEEEFTRQAKKKTNVGRGKRVCRMARGVQGLSARASRRKRPGRACEDWLG